MNRFLNGATSVLAIAVCAAGAAQAATLEAISTADYRLEIEIAGSNLPEGVSTSTIGFLVGSPGLPQSDVSSIVDHPNAVTTQILEDPFADAFNTSASRTVIGATGEGVEVSHEFDVNQEVYINVNAPVLGTQEFLGTSRAEAQFSDNPSVSTGQTTHEFSRYTRITNASGNRVTFSVSGLLDVDLLAQTEGDYSFASSSAMVGLDFFDLFRTNVTYVPLDTFFLDREEVGVAASTLDMFTGNNGGLSFDGAAFTASDGAVSSSSLGAFHRFLFAIDMEDGGSFKIGMNSAHIMQTVTAPADVPAVPVPAPAIMLFTGMLAFAGFKRTAARRSQQTSIF